MYAIWDVKSSLGKREEAEGVCDLGERVREYCARCKVQEVRCKL